ncbi:MAG: transglycosylase domain-containing protein [Pseudomonadota bacterium]
MAGTKSPKPPLVAEARYKKAAQTAAKRSGSKQKSKRKAAKAAKRTPKRFHWALRPFVWVFRLLWRLITRSVLVGALMIGAAAIYVAATLPPIEDLIDGRAVGSVTLLDVQDQTYAWRGEQFGGLVTSETVSRHLKNAVIATEDKRFYWHPGIDPRGIASAVRINLREGRGPLSGHGGSTLSQQTAKLLCLGRPFVPSEWPSEAAYEADCREGSVWRKAKEAVYAMGMEIKYSKEAILTIYLNRAFLGAGARGFEAASQRYFGKPASQVSPAEAAMLAGLLVAPSRYAPTNNLKRSQDRAAVIVGLMEDQGYLSKSAADRARAEPATLSQAAKTRTGGAFADWVMASGPEFFTRDTTEDVIIRTTLDPEIQAAAEDAVALIFQERVREGSQAQAAVVVMSADGAVRAMVGGRDPSVVSGFNRATQAKRQVGSTFKPFVYGAALDLGYSPYDLLLDAPLTLNVPGSGPWSPSNYSNEFMGDVTLTSAFANSLNIPAVRLSEAVGREVVSKVAKDFGILNDLAEGPALALGVSESTLLEMTGAYAGILNGGSSVTPYGLIDLRLQGEEEPLMGTGGGIGERVISPQSAGQLVYLMNEVVTSGTGQRAAVSGWDLAGKSGTTQASRDAWFIGFSSDYVVGVWMGYDDNTPLEGVTGGGLPAEIFRETMVRVHETRPPKPLPMIVPDPGAATKTTTGVEGEVATTQPKDSQAEGLILEVLGAIFGRRN